LSPVLRSFDIAFFSTSRKLASCNHWFQSIFPEGTQMSKSRDTKKAEGKKPKKTAKEKKQAKRDKKKN
jgi:hypothetical protein